jgi:hypothetical protein
MNYIGGLKTKKKKKHISHISKLDKCSTLNKETYT